jgi:hypothetical protein
MMKRMLQAAPGPGGLELSLSPASQRISYGDSRAPRHVAAASPAAKTAAVHRAAPRSAGARAGQTHGEVTVGGCQSE